MTAKYTFEKISGCVDGCSDSAIRPDVRDFVARHLLRSIGCAIGAMSAKVTQDIKAVVDVFGGNQMCTPRLVEIEALKRFEEVRRPLGRRPDDHPSLSDVGLWEARFATSD
jgi:hypothetical protein